MTTDAERKAATRAEQRLAERPTTCAHPDCGAVLSRFNDGDLCYQHAPSTVMRRRGRSA